MAYTFPVHPRRKTIAGSPIVAASPVFPYVERPIPGALGDWAFGVDADSFVPIGGGATLTAQNTTHTFGTNWVETKAYQQGLLTNIDEVAEITVWAAWKYIKSGSKTLLVIGNITNGLASGFSIGNASNGGLTAACYRAPGSAIVVNLSGDLNIPAGLVDGDIIFGALSMAPLLDESEAEVGTRLRVKLSGCPATEFTTSSTRVLSTSDIAVGDAYFSNSGYTPVNNRVYSFGVLPRESTLAELNDLYAKIARRLVERGETVK